MNRKFSGLLTVLITACLCQAWFFTSFAYVFETEGIEISMNQDASQVLSELGKAESFYEADSCTHQGKERVFTYNGFELSTYPSGGGDFVKSVWFLGEETSTPPLRRCRKPTGTTMWKKKEGMCTLPRMLFLPFIRRRGWSVEWSIKP